MIDQSVRIQGIDSAQTWRGFGRFAELEGLLGLARYRSRTSLRIEARSPESFCDAPLWPLGVVWPMTATGSGAGAGGGGGAMKKADEVGMVKVWKMASYSSSLIGCRVPRLIIRQ